jgi:hypothetical protein
MLVSIKEALIYRPYKTHALLQTTAQQSAWNSTLEILYLNSLPALLDSQLQAPGHGRTKLTRCPASCWLYSSKTVTLYLNLVQQGFLKKQ